VERASLRTDAQTKRKRAEYAGVMSLYGSGVKKSTDWYRSE